MQKILGYFVAVLEFLARAHLEQALIQHGGNRWQQAIFTNAGQAHQLRNTQVIGFTPVADGLA